MLHSNKLSKQTETDYNAKCCFLKDRACTRTSLEGQFCPSDWQLNVSLTIQISLQMQKFLEKTGQFKKAGRDLDYSANGVLFLYS